MFMLENKFVRLLAFLLPVILISGCVTLGPDYKEPDVEWLNNWETDLYGQIGTPQEQSRIDLKFWWKMFDDPVLDTLIEIGKRENRSLRAAGIRILESRAALGIAVGYQYPQVQQVTGAIGYVNSQSNDGTSQSLSDYNADFNIGWEIDFWGKYKRSIESADAAFFNSIANQQNLQVLLYSQIADLYFAYRTALLRIEIAKENAEIQKRSYEITNTLFQSGQTSELDQQQAKTQYMSTLANIPDREKTLMQVRNAICAILGRAPRNIPELDENIKELPEVDPIVLEEIPAQLLLRRPDIRAAAALIAIQSAQVGIAETELYPSISLFGNIGYSGNSDGGNPNTLSLGIGPSLTWNIFNYGRIKNNIRVQDARLQEAIENFQNSALQAAREIDDAAIGVVKTGEQRDPQRQSTQAAIRSVELANKRYREGFADFQRVLEAQRALATQNEKLITNNSSHISAIVSFYKAVGGGWLDMRIDQVIPESTRDTMESRTNWGDLLMTPLPVTSDSLNSKAEVK